jgi:hypothetical protein
LKGIDHLRGLDIYLKIILKEQGGVTCGPNSTGSGKSPMAGPCEQRNEPSDSIKGGEISWRIEQLKTSEKVSVP